MRLISQPRPCQVLPWALGRRIQVPPPPPPSLNTTSATQRSPQQPAGFWIRLAAYLIDQVLLIPLLALALFNYIFWKELGIFWLLIGAGTLYKPFMEGLWGATFGKLALGLRVVREQGGKPSLATACFRNVFFYLGPLVLLMTNSSLFEDPQFQATQNLQEILALQEHYAAGPLELLANVLLGVSVALIFASPLKQALHDRAANTMVLFDRQAVNRHA